jgi:type III restriction enzyme
MKLHFEPSLDFQLAAIRSITDLFRGQEVCRTTFTVARDTSRAGQTYRDDDIGIGNRLLLIEDDLLRNLQEVQLTAGLPVDERLASRDFTVEMETGTGKTYVYLRTIFALHRDYGFTKFVIVVPSVAIKEGVFKTMKITREHFETLYPEAKGYQFFLYNSGNPGEVRNFAVSPQVQVMIVTVGAINKKEVNNLYKVSEKTNDVKPIDLIVQTSPIVIVDEPQSVDGGLEGRGKEALAAMKPLCTLRYSATHQHKHHMVYRLDAIEAYQRKLVKQIEVAGMQVEGSHNRAYLRLVSVKAKRKRPVAVIEVDIQQGAKVIRKELTVTGTGLDLAEETGRDLYANMRIENFGLGRIAGERGWLQISGHAAPLSEGDCFGGIDDMQLQRLMLRRAIREHLEKERRLRPKGIKVLSLFFVKSVRQYRAIDANGVPLAGVLGPVEKLFREEFLAQVGAYSDLYPTTDPAALAALANEIQGGYFSIDKNKQITDPELDAAGELKNEKSREDAARAYELIMSKKEELLDLRTPLRFIFSHSALREGWDNPNVFQICNLRDMGSERERRQTIGRGLRICVDQTGQRVRDPAINTLTVIASERFEDYAEKLQTEIQEQTGLTFGTVTAALFAGITIRRADGTLAPLGDAAGQTIQQHLIAQGYIDQNGKVQDALREAIRGNTVVLSEAFAAQATAITNLLRSQAGKLEISDADKKRTITRNKQVFASPEFQALWDRIKHKTIYRVAFDNEKLITDCIAEIRDEMPRIPRTRVQFRTAGITMDRSGLGTEVREESAPYAVDDVDIPLPDVLTELEDRTKLTRRSIGRILLESARIDDFARNPQRFIEDAADRINRKKQHALVDGIKYQRIGEAEYFAQELFPEHELVSYLKGVVATPNRGVFDQVLCDSTPEENFAADLDRNEVVKVFAKLPSTFAVPTPLGDYHPDWAVLVEQHGQERLYLVVETKSSRFADDLRQKENDKIACGKQHFSALAAGQSAPTIQFKDKITRLSDLFA